MFKRVKNTTDVGNKKIKNSTKVVYDGITFDSKLEFYFYELCKLNDIKVELKKIYVLQDKFEYQGEKFRKIEMIPDFYLVEYNHLVETKGFANDVYPMKRKMLLNTLRLEGNNTKYSLLKTKKECLEFVNNLKFNN